MVALSEPLARLRAGEIPFSRFAAETRPAWQNMARYLAQHWRPPVGVTVDDLEQELLVAAWRAVPRWDPTRGPTLERYVTFQAIDKAKKWLQKQRNTKRRDDNAPARLPMNLSRLSRHDGDGERAADADDFAADGEVPENIVAEREERAAVVHYVTSAAASLTWRQRLAIQAVAQSGGDLDDAVAIILVDRGLCLACRVGSDAAAEQLAKRTVRRIYALTSGGSAE